MGKAASSEGLDVTPRCAATTAGAQPSLAQGPSLAQRLQEACAVCPSPGNVLTNLSVLLCWFCQLVPYRSGRLMLLFF